MVGCVEVEGGKGGVAGLGEEGGLVEGGVGMGTGGFTMFGLSVMDGGGRRQVDRLLFV